jgi:hypothetical protein
MVLGKTYTIPNKNALLGRVLEGALSVTGELRASIMCQAMTFGAQRESNFPLACPAPAGLYN